MPGFTPFTSNYEDLSNNQGYQFEFRCDICGSGYRSEFIRSTLGTGSSTPRRRQQPHRRRPGAARRMPRHGPGRDRPRRPGQGPPEGLQRDHAAVPPLRAVQQLGGRDLLQQAARACASTAPRTWPPRWRPSDPPVELNQMREAMQGQQVFSGDTSARATECPNCGKPVGSEKFCGNCGTPLGTAKCRKCGDELAPGLKFCGNCGNKVG